MIDIYTPDVYKCLYDKASGVNHFVADTGRDTGKTENFGRRLVLKCRETQKSALICREDEKYIKGNIYASVKRIINRMGIANEYDFPKSPPYQIKAKNGKYTIDFFGIGDDPYKIKGYEPLNEQICCVWFEEFSNLPSKEYMDIASETVSRFSDRDTIWLYSGNPNASACSWDRIWTNQVRNLRNYKVLDITFADMWNILKDTNKDEIKTKYLLDPEKWKQTYLGEPANDSGLVYNNINRDDHYIDTQQQLDDAIIAWVLGVDVALSHDKTGIVFEVKLANGRIITVKSFCHDPKTGSQIVLTPDKQALVVKTIYDKLKEEGCFIGGKNVSLRDLPNAIIVDTSDFGVQTKLHELGYPAYKVNHKSVMADIQRGKSLIDRNMMYIVEADCQALVFELENLAWRQDINEQVSNFKQQGINRVKKYVIGEDDIENAWRYGHSWLSSGLDNVTVLPPLKNYYYKREIDIMNLSDLLKEKGGVVKV